MNTKICWCTLIAVCLLIPIAGSSQSVDKNFVKTTKPGVPVEDTSSLFRMDWKQKQEIIEYYDGEGRIIQKIQSSVTPSGKDLLETYRYDLAGRKTIEYLPFPVEPAKGQYFDDPVRLLLAYYLDPDERVTATAFPFSEKKFDDSPLKETIALGYPGASWQLETNHTKRSVKYGNPSEITHWSVAENGQCIQAGTYSPGTLHVTENLDENGTVNREYRNRSGQVILKEKLLEDLPVQTFFVYDRKDNLRYVIPPMAVSGQTADPGLIYSFEYDDKYRITRKKIPGAAVVEYVYDHMNRQALKQDGNLRRDSLWLYSKYDAYGRPVITGVFKSILGRAVLQDLADAGVQNYETCTGGTYTNTVFPVENTTPFSILYYDDYEFIDDPQLRYEAASFLLKSEGPEIIEPELAASITGAKTGAKTLIPGTGNWLKSVTYFDKYGRSLQSVFQNHLGGTNRTSFIYNFRGQLVNEKSRCAIQNAVPVILEKKYTYDQAGRILRTVHKINDQPEVVLSEYEYNELGQLAVKKLHSEDGGQTFTESITNTYNVRGWLCGINDPYNPGASLFSLRLNYESPENGLQSVPQFNGNISSALWSSSNLSLPRGYAYNYDNLNRLTSASFGKFSGAWSRNEEDYSVPAYTYDLNGNILSLVRRGKISTNAFGVADELEYTYSGNRLTFVDDAAELTEDEWDFIDGGLKIDDANGMPEYLYDDNGNMTTDANKGINNIRYNALNLPEEIWMESNRLIRNTYDASGTKLRTEAFDSDGYPLSVRDYIGAIVYNHKLPEYILTPEGRAVPEGESYHYEYFLKDHLGNTRVTFRVVAGVTQVVQENHYYPFGMRLFGLPGEEPGQASGPGNRILYNSKELLSDFGLNWYDYGARYYDPQVGRWWTIDPKTEAAPDWTPYRYGLNNPVRFIDPDGMLEDWYQSENGALFWEDSGEEEIEVDGENYKKVGKVVSIKSGDKFINYYENVPISISDVPLNAAVTIQNNVDLENQLLSDKSPLSLRAKVDLLRASMTNATGQAAQVMFEGAMMVAPMPKIGVGVKAVGKYAPKISKYLNTLYIKGGVRGNLYVNIGKREVIKDISKIWQRSSFSFKKKFSKTGIPKIVKQNYNTETNIFFDPKYQNIALDILSNALTR